MSVPDRMEEGARHIPVFDAKFFGYFNRIGAHPLFLNPLQSNALHTNACVYDEDMNMH